MAYFQTKLQRKGQRWICSCKRINDKEDEKCAFCGEAKPEKTKGRKNQLGSVARKSEYNGRYYHSNMEAKYAQELDFRKLAGEVLEWTPQHKIELKINGKKWRNYYIDFRVILKDLTIQYHEVKGYSTEVFKMKWDVLNILKDELLEPGAELIMIK